MVIRHRIFVGKEMIILKKGTQGSEALVFLLTSIFPTWVDEQNAH